MKNKLFLTFALIGALCACQKVEMAEPQPGEFPSEGTRASSFSSQFGIDWSAVPKQSSTCTYAAFKSLQVTCDADNLYMLLTANPSLMTTNSSYDYANVLNVYLGNSSDTNSSYWVEKATNVSAMGGWLMKNGVPRFTSWGSGVTCQAVNVSGTYYYEIRYPRTISEKLQQHSDVLVGVYMNNRYNVNNTNSTGYSVVGIRPNNGSNMYWLSLNNYLGVGGGGNSGNTLVSKEDYTQTSSDIANPERGFYLQMDFVFRDGAVYYGDDVVDLTSLGTDINNFTQGSLIQTNFWLKQFKSTSTITPAAVQTIKNILGIVRSKGKKAIVRFAYSDSDSSSERPYDATKSRILSHVSTLSDVFSEYEDVIYIVQMGFIGAWGEWHYSTNFTTDGVSNPDFTYYDPVHNIGRKWYENSQWYHSTQVLDFGNRRDVIQAVLDVVPTSRQVAVRTPMIKRMFLSPNNIEQYEDLNGFYNNDMTSGQKKNARLALFNDVYMLDGDKQMNTFVCEYDKQMWKQQSAFLACGGETGSIDSSMEHYQDYINYMNSLSQNDVLNNLKQHHMSYLHYHMGSYLFQDWYSKGWLTPINKTLGYRLWVSKLKMTGPNKNQGSTVTFEVTIRNSGAAPVINPRPMKLVLMHGSTAVTLGSLGDIRKVPSDGSYKYTLTVSLPQTIVSGDKLAVWLPDAESNLQSNSKFSIRLANSSSHVTWSSGYNLIYTF